MQVIRAIQIVEGNQSVIPLPPEWAGKKVEVMVRVLSPEEQSLAPSEPKVLPIMERKPLSPRLQKMIDDNPNILHGSVLKYEDPFGPACPIEDWDSELEPQ